MPLKSWGPGCSGPRVRTSRSGVGAFRGVLDGGAWWRAPGPGPRVVQGVVAGDRRGLGVGSRAICEDCLVPSVGGKVSNWQLRDAFEDYGGRAANDGDLRRLAPILRAMLGATRGRSNYGSQREWRGIPLDRRVLSEARGE